MFPSVASPNGYGPGIRAPAGPVFHRNLRPAPGSIHRCRAEERANRAKPNSRTPPVPGSRFELRGALVNPLLELGVQLPNLDFDVYALGDIAVRYQDGCAAG